MITAPLLTGQPPPSFTLELPYPPTTNNLYATVRGRRVLSKAGREYKATTAWLVKARRQGALPLGGRLGFRMIVHCPDRRRRDLSNLLKVVEDALKDGQGYFDDSQIDELHVLRDAPLKGGRIVVTVWQQDSEEE